MLACSMPVKLRINCSSRLLFKSIPQYSNSAGTAPQNGVLLEEYLMDSLGFSKQEAITASCKVRRFRSSMENPNLVINLLHNLGLDKTQIKSVVSFAPKLLWYDPDKTLKPKIQLLQELGLSGQDLVKVIMGHRNRTILMRGLENHIRPRIEFLRKLLRSDEKVVLALRKSVLLLERYAPQKLAQNVLLFRDIGFSDEQLSRFIVRNPNKILVQTAEWVQEAVNTVENDFGIPRKSNMFFYGIEVFLKLHVSTVNKRFDILRSFGWSDDQIRKMVSTHPNTLCTSDDKMKRALNFFMKELGYSPDYLASRPTFFFVNVEKRVKPRMEILKILNEEKLKQKKASLCAVVCLPELKFVRRYLLPYKDMIPDVYNSYVESVKREEATKNLRNCQS